MAGFRSNHLKEAFGVYREKLEEAYGKKLAIEIEGVPSTNYSDSHTRIKLSTAAGIPIMSWLMDTMGNNCGVALMIDCYSLFGRHGKRPNDFSKWLSHMCQLAARRSRYGILMATTNAGQRRANTTLEATGFKSTGKTRNPNSGNQIQVWTKNLVNVARITSLDEGS